MAILIVPPRVAQIIGEVTIFQQRVDVFGRQIGVDRFHQGQNAGDMGTGHGGAGEKGVDKAVTGTAGAENAIRIAVAINISAVIAPRRGDIDFGAEIGVGRDMPLYVHGTYRDDIVIGGGVVKTLAALITCGGHHDNAGLAQVVIQGLLRLTKATTAQAQVDNVCALLGYCTGVIG